jgi:hypothetical protein
MYALSNTAFTHTCSGDYTTASAQADELVALADGTPLWGKDAQGSLLPAGAGPGKVPDARRG